MPDDRKPDEPTRKRPPARRADAKQAADALGDLLPDTTRDESAREWGDRDGSRDDELLGDVPPHHG